MTRTQLPPPPSLDTLCAQDTVSLFLDFDGTLVAIASGPDAIIVPADLAVRLKVLSDGMEGRLALVSGRGLDDIERHLGTLDIARAGSHGAHCVAADGETLGTSPEPLDPRALAGIERLARSHGSQFERKPHGAALHYRADPSCEADLDKAATDLAAQHGLDIQRGKYVVELVRPGGGKAGAVDCFMMQAPFAQSIPIFLGDDVTDEDGFAAAKRHGGFGIAVGERPSQGANYAIADVEGVHRWLTL